MLSPATYSLYITAPGDLHLELCCIGSTLIPEIQATAKEPAARTMYGGFGVLYTLIAFTYLPVTVTGYWAYGTTAAPLTLPSSSPRIACALSFADRTYMGRRLWAQ